MYISENKIRRKASKENIAAPDGSCYMKETPKPAFRGPHITGMATYATLRNNGPRTWKDRQATTPPHEHHPESMSRQAYHRLFFPLSRLKSKLHKESHTVLDRAFSIATGAVVVLASDFEGDDAGERMGSDSCCRGRGPGRTGESFLICR